MLNKLTLESENVIKAGSIRFFREGGATRSFSALVAGFQDTLGNSQGRMIIPEQSTPTRRRNKNNPSDTEEVTSNEDGLVVFSNAVVGDEQIITTEFESANGNRIVEFTANPNYDDEFVGTIPLLEEGYNFKTTYSVNTAQLLHGYMYGSGYRDYDVTIEIENIGNSEARTTVWEIGIPDGLYVTSGSTIGNFSTIPSGDKRTIDLVVTAGNINNDFEDKIITISITDSETERTWEDFAVLRFYRLPVSFKVRAYNIDGSGSLKAFLITPDNRSIFFQVDHNSTSALTVPYRSSPYLLAFSGAGHKNEMKYSFAAGANPTQVADEPWSIEQIKKYRSHDSELKSFLVTDPTTSIDGYLGVDEINFFSVDLSPLRDRDFKAITYHAHLQRDYGNTDNIPNPGETMTMDIRIQNLSGSPKNGVKAVLSSSSPYISFDKDTYSYGDIPAGYYASIYDSYYESYSNYVSLNASDEDAFSFTIADTTPFDTEIPITMTFEDSSGNIWTDEFSLTVVKTDS